MLLLASTQMQVHTRQTVYGSTSFSELPSAHVDYGGYIRTLFSVVFFVGIIFFFGAQCVYAEQQESIFGNFELISGPIATDSGSTYKLAVNCYGHGKQAQSRTYCHIDVHGSSQEYIGLDSIFLADGRAYIRINDFAHLDLFQFDGHSSALFSLVRPAFPLLKKQWLDVGDGSFLDKREQLQVHTYVLPELTSCIRARVEQCHFTESTQLMIRSILVGRTVVLLGSDDHMKQKLHALDQYLEEGIPITYDHDKISVHVTNEIVFSLSPKTSNTYAPEYNIPAHVKPIGEALDRALSSLY